MEVAYLSDIGKKRVNNEDSVGTFKNKAGATLVIIADGLGGYQGGEIASGMAVSHLGYLFEQTQFIHEYDCKLWLKEKVALENQVILTRAHEYEDLQGMGTTLVCAFIYQTNCLIAHIGDSRAYLFRQEILTQMTEDHSWVNELVKRGELSKEEAKSSPKKNIITRTLGISDSAKLDFNTCQLKDNDILLLCSDGLTNMVADDFIASVLGKTELSLKDKCQILINQANQNGGKDNITALLAQKKVEKKEVDNT
ncbi:protein phosphatase [Ligilactobacillus sp. WC1T17]|uniref:Protein phosphatase n=1 Tax=Ligilactobacillus ruminis TaxID=1623 RepID=A0ABY1ABM9_9LACO|nr:protein phosphatase [Ligilactobacillus ruminis]